MQIQDIFFDFLPLVGGKERAAVKSRAHNFRGPGTRGHSLILTTPRLLEPVVLAQVDVKNR